MNEEYMTIDDFAVEVGVTKSTVYRWLKQVPNIRTKMQNGRKHHAESSLYEALRRSKMLGVRDIQGKLGVALRDLKPAGFSGYAVCARGRVYRTDKNARRIKTRRRESDGYYIVDLGDYKTQYVHRLVAAAFLGLPYSKTQQVDHLDGNKSNNKAENLEWVSPSENLKRRNKRLFSNPHRPNKYTRKELGCLKSAFLRGLKYNEFCSLHSNIKISGTHYRRLNKDCPAAGAWPLWSEIPSHKRWAIAKGILFSDSYFSASGEVDFEAIVFPSGIDCPMTAEEYLLMRSWLDFHDIRDDLAKFIRAEIQYHNQSGAYEDRDLEDISVQVDLYSQRLKYLTEFQYFFNRTISMWWSPPVGYSRAPIATPVGLQRIRPTIRTTEVIELSRLGLLG